MSLKKRPDGPSREVNYAKASPAQQVRDLLTRASLSQRQGARELGIDERTMRYWCSGDHEPPRMALLALKQLSDATTVIRDDSESKPTYGAGQPAKYLREEICFWWDESDKAIHVTTAGAEVPLHATFPNDPSSEHWHPAMFTWLAEMLRAADRPAPGGPKGGGS